MPEQSTQAFSPEYAIEQVLADDSPYGLYRVRRCQNGQRLLLKVAPRQAYRAVEKLRREVALSRQYDLDGVLRVVAWSESEDACTLVLEDPGGEPMDQLLNDGPLALTTALGVAQQLAQTLAALHQRKLVHRDLQPRHVWLDVPSGEVWLTGLGNASQTLRELPNTQTSELLQLDLRYLSPEQTGRLHQLVDYRSDYYSLGVLLFAMLTGRCPFAGDSRLALLHAHIAQTPPVPSELAPMLPETVSRIVRKLLAKAADERYQSGWGIASDLARCQRELTRTGTVPAFALASNDAPLHFELPQRLYGREDELAQLVQCLDDACQGATQVCLVAGYTGVGRTALAQAFRQTVLQRGGLFAGGKCDELERSRPYASLLQALRALTRRLLSAEETTLAAYREQLNKTLGANLGVMVEWIPELEAIVGEAPPVAALGPEQAKHRLYHCVGQFLAVFAGPGQPLVLFLDDLQWLDDSSLVLIDRLLEAAPGHFLLLGAYRDNELDADHPLLRSLAEHGARGLALTTLTLRPLELLQVRHFLADALRTDNPRLTELAALVYRKTAGNPFFLRTFLNSLYEQGGLHFEVPYGWIWEAGIIAGLEETENVIDMLIDRIRQLPHSMPQILATASALSGDFAVERLATLCDNTTEAVESQLREAARVGFLVKQGSHYRFAHDRVRESVYHLIPEPERAQLHWHMARLLAEQPHHEQAPAVFDLVNHLKRAGALLDDPATRAWAIDLNVAAGRAARASDAFPAAFEYFSRALALLDERAWVECYALALVVHSETMQAAYLNADFAAAQRLAEQVHEHARAPLERMPAYEVQTGIAYAERRERDAQKLALEGLKRLGVELPLDPAPEAVKSYARDLARRVEPVLSGEGAELPLMTDPVMSAAGRLLTSAAYACAWSNVPLLQFAVNKAVELTLQYGFDSQSTQAWAGSAMVFCQLENLDAGERLGAFALSLLERLPAQAEEPLCRFLVDIFVRVYRTPLDKVCERLPAIFRLAVERGDLQVAGSCCYQYGVLSLHAGRPLAEVTQIIQDQHDASAKLGQKAMAVTLSRLLQRVRVLQGEAAGTTALPDPSQARDPNVVVRVVGSEMMALYLLRQSEAALQLALATESLPETVLPAIPGEFYRCLILLDRHPGLSAEQREHTLAKAEPYRQRLVMRARIAPQSYQHKLDLVEAERLRGLGQTMEAMAHYAKAIEGARRSGLVQEEAIAFERSAEFHLELEQVSVAAPYLQAAASAYGRWGANAKLAQLYERHPGLLAATTLPRPLASVRTASGNNTAAATTVRKTAEDLDLQSVENAASLLRSEFELPKLLTQLMRLVLENAGAQRGVLVHQAVGNLVIDTSGTVDGEDLRITHGASRADPEALPETVLRYVIRTGEPLVLDDAARDTRFTKDAYLQNTQPASLLCLPLWHQGRAAALLYLEHHELRGVFSIERLAAIQLIAAEATGNLENARLYHDLQWELERRRQAEVELRTLKDKLAAENVYLQQEIQSAQGFEEIVGNSDAIRAVLQQVELVAATDATVLILGETGTGKELIARAVHKRSPRRDQALIRVNCAMLPASLIESELFGHEKGAFTGALTTKIGRFELADEGTLFLDEIGDLPLELQAKLLRVLQEGEFERLGATQTRKVDVRIIAATNRAIQEEVAQGVFRSDLYYRLNVFPIQLPRLRERREDIPLLVWYFIIQYQGKLGKTIKAVPARLMEALQAYSWPGNVRELENLIERAMILSPAETLLLDEALLSFGTEQDNRPSRPHPQDELQAIERNHILTVLEQCGWKIKGPGNAAERLGLKPSTLRSRMKKLGIERP